MHKVRNWIGLVSTPIIVTSVGCAVTSQPMANNQRSLTPERMMTVAKTFERQGHLAQARVAYQQVLAVQPQNSNAQQSFETLVALENQQFQVKFAQQYVPANGIMMPQQQMAMSQMTYQMPVTMGPMPTSPAVTAQMMSVPATSMPMQTTQVPMTPMTTIQMPAAQLSNSTYLAPLAQIPAQRMSMRSIPMHGSHRQMANVPVQSPMVQQSAPMPTSQYVTQMPIAAPTPMATQMPAAAVPNQMSMMPATPTMVHASRVIMPSMLPNAPMPSQMTIAPPARLIEQAGAMPANSNPAYVRQQSMPASTPMVLPATQAIAAPPLQSVPSGQRVSRATSSSPIIRVSAATVVPPLSVTPVSLSVPSPMVIEEFDSVELPSPVEPFIPVDLPSPSESTPPATLPGLIEAIPVPESPIQPAVDTRLMDSKPESEMIQAIADTAVAPWRENATQACDADFRLPVVVAAESPFNTANKFQPIDDLREEAQIDLSQISDPSLQKFFGEFSTQVVDELKSHCDKFVSPICNLAADSTKQRELRTRAVFLLGAIGSDASSAVPTLRRAMHHTRDAYLRVDLAETILKIQGSDPDAVEVLVDCLQLSNRGVKLVAAFALRNVAPSEIPRAIEGLERWVRTDDLKLKRMIYLTLGEYGPAAARAIPYLEAELASSDPATREVAAASLAAIAPERAEATSVGSAADLF